MPAQNLGGGQNPLPLTRSVAGSSNIHLPLDNAQHEKLIFTGALTGNISVYFPVSALSAGHRWRIQNDTTGAFTLTVRGQIGSGVAVTQGASANLLWTGADMEDEDTAPTSFAIGDVVLTNSAAGVLSMGADVLHFGTPVSPTGTIEVQSAANNNTTARIRVVNTADTSTSTAAGAEVFVSGGSTGATASGALAAYGDSYVDVTRRNRLVLRAQSDCGNGISIDANYASGGLISFLVGAIGEQVRLFAGGQLNIGIPTGTALARFASVGRADEIQSRIRAHSTQTNNISEVEASDGTTKYWAITGSTAGAGRMIFTTLASAIADGSLANSQASFYLDAAENNLIVKVKTSGGTVKTATIAIA